MDKRAGATEQNGNNDTNVEDGHEGEPDREIDIAFNTIGREVILIRVFTFNAIITYATAILILLATRFLLFI